MVRVERRGGLLDEVGLVLGGSVDGRGLAGDLLAATAGSVTDTGEKGGQDAESELETALSIIWNSENRVEEWLEGARIRGGSRPGGRRCCI